MIETEFSHYLETNFKSNYDSHGEKLLMTILKKVLNICRVV